MALYEILQVGINNYIGSMVTWWIIVEVQNNLNTCYYFLYLHTYNYYIFVYCRIISRPCPTVPLPKQYVRTLASYLRRKEAEVYFTYTLPGPWVFGVAIWWNRHKTVELMCNKLALRPLIRKSFALYVSRLLHKRNYESTVNWTVPISIHNFGLVER